MSEKKLYGRVLLTLCAGIFFTIIKLPAQDVGKAGVVTGFVKDENNNPIAGVSIVVEKRATGTSSSVNGEFRIALAAGTYTLLFSAIGFESKRITEVTVKAGKEYALSITLSEKKSNSLQNVVITATARQEGTRGLLQAQKNNAGMTDGISAEQMSKTPDANTAQVLKRVSGVTVQSGKFVTVRGVSERYNNVLINGSALPSTEPNRKNFSFDIIPAALVENVVVNKTASPDLSGEFTGGIVQVNTKDVPVKNFLQISLGTGINTQSNNKEFVSYKRDKKAHLGKADPERYYLQRGGLLDPEVYARYLIVNDTAAMQRVGRLIPNRWQRYKYPYQPAQQYQFFSGLVKKIDDTKTFGLIGAATYRNDMQYENGEGNSWGVNQGSSIRHKYTTNLGGMLNLACKTPKFKLSIKNFYNLTYSDQTDERLVYDYATTSNQSRFSSQTLINKIWQTRVAAEHVISKQKIKLDWYADIISLKRDQPDSRFLTTTITQGGAGSYNFAEKNMRWGGMFSSVFKEERKNRGINILLPFSVKEQRQSIKIGYGFSERNAGFYATPIRIIDDSNLVQNNYISRVQGLPYYKFVTQEAFGQGSLRYYFGYTKTTTGAGASTGASTGDGYDGTQKLHAGYVMGDFKILKKLRLTGGLRIEYNTVDINTIFYEPVTNPPSLKIIDTVKTYTERDLLPSVNLVFSLNTKTNLRAAYSKTIARPDFVERTPYRYFDFVEQSDVYGEKELVITRIENYDLRYEYFPTGEEILSASLFYKNFDRPVERKYLFINPYGIINYLNHKSAKAYGFEMDARKSLGFINPGNNFLKKLFISGNFTYLRGEIVFSSTDTLVKSDQRPIEGLSPYIINGGIGYQTDMFGVQVSYNRSGPKVILGGDDRALVQYEKPRNIVDVQFNGRLMKQKLELKLNMGDLLNEPFIIYTNSKKNGISSSGTPTEPIGELNDDPRKSRFNKDHDFINYQVKKGIGFSFSITYRL